MADLDTTRWWKRLPERLDDELEALGVAGFDPELDRDRLDDAGVVRIGITLEIDGRRVAGTVVYPELFPYFRPEVVIPTLRLERHQNPIEHNLCLLGRSTDNWTPSWTAAMLLSEQLDDVLAAANDPQGEIAEGREEHQGEPVTTYYPWVPGSAVLVDGDGMTSEGDDGEFVLRVGYVARSETPRLQSALVEMRGSTRLSIRRSSDGLCRLPGGDVSGRWKRLEAPLDLPLTDENLGDVLRSIPGEPHWTDLPEGGRYAVDGVLVPEEVGWREFAWSWVFILSIKVKKIAPRPRKGTRQPAGSSVTEVQSWLVRAERAGPADLAERVPELNGLLNKTVLIVGLGSIGAPIAHELGRAGIGEVRLVDPDTLSAGNTVRWPAGVSDAGGLKVEQLKKAVGAAHPHTNVVASEMRIGSSRLSEVSDGRSQLDELRTLLSDVDLVIDAAAESGVSHWLSDATRQVGIPHICATGTQGGWGGIVAAFDSDRESSCWMCLQLAQTTGRLTGPAAAAAGVGRIQPTGCADPTFTGAGFDMASIGLAATRMAVAHLVEGYPTPSWNVEVWNLRTSDGQPAREVLTHHLAREESCESLAHRPAG